jgi:hypothetical protein
MTRLHTLIAGVLLCLPAAASFAQATAQAEAKRTQKSLSDLTASSDDVCRMFTAAEVSKALGVSVRNGAPWGFFGGGCEWAANEKDAVQVVVVRDTSYWENLKNVEGGEALSGFGKEAFVAPWLGAFRAGALTDRGCVYVMTPKREVSVDLLRRAVERIPKH